MNTAALREQIQKAQQHEAATGLLMRQLESKLPQLHPSIQLPEADAHGVLTRFVAAYIDEVPDLLDAANEVAREAGIESQIKPVLKIAEQYFLQPPNIMAGHVGLDSLLDEAYLAHRFVEEVNDLYIKHFGQPLIPLDMTVANLIAHQHHWAGRLGNGPAQRLVCAQNFCIAQCIGGVQGHAQMRQPKGQAIHHDEHMGMAVLADGIGQIPSLEGPHVDSRNSGRFDYC